MNDYTGYAGKPLKSIEYAYLAGVSSAFGCVAIIGGMQIYVDTGIIDRILLVLLGAVMLLLAWYLVLKSAAQKRKILQIILNGK